MTGRRGPVVAAAAIVAVLAAVALYLVLRPSGGATPAAPSPSPAASVSPFTGEPVSGARPVLAVKIDNVAQARPATGLSEADLVYVLPVEGGLSRLMAVFSSRTPPTIGPVRSARETDLELLRQFGRPAFAYSGATSKLLPIVESARTVDLYAGRVAGYFRENTRPAPHNLYADTQKLLSEATGASGAADIGFRFGAAPAGGVAATSFAIGYSSAAFAFAWSPSAGRWLVSMDGAPATVTQGGQLGAATVVIQYTSVTGSQYLEEGTPPPFAHSVGSGRAVVLRDGMRYDAAWSRPNADGGTTFTTAAGAPMTFERGPVWIVLTAA